LHVDQVPHTRAKAQQVVKDRRHAPRAALEQFLRQRGLPLLLFLLPGVDRGLRPAAQCLCARSLKPPTQNVAARNVLDELFFLDGLGVQFLRPVLPDLLVQAGPFIGESMDPGVAAMREPATGTVELTSTRAWASGARTVATGDFGPVGDLFGAERARHRRV